MAECLGRRLHHLFYQGESWFYASTSSRIPYLAFEDDILNFTWCSDDCLETRKSFLDYYQAYLGQKVNPRKSSLIISSQALEDQCVLVSSKLQFSSQGLPLTYLGTPISRERGTYLLFGTIISHMRERLFHWSSRLLSSEGKLVLIQHMVISIPIYLL